MEVGGLLRVEAVKRCGRSKADRDGGTAGQVQTTQPDEVVRLASAIDSLPYPLQHTGIQHRLELASGQVSQNLATARDAMLTVEQGVELRMHGSDRHGLAVV